MFSHVSVIDMVEELKAITNGTVIGSTEVVAVVSVLETAAEFTNEVAGNTMVKLFFNECIKIIIFFS